LDVKPYVFADYIADYQCPPRVNNVLEADRRVEFAEPAIDALDAIV